MRMLKYVIKRLLLMVMNFFIITTICFVLIKLLPLPAVKEMGRDYNLIMARREAMGYNRPLLVQYYLFWKNVLVHGDFGLGEQLYSGQEVSTIILQKLPYTVMVNVYSILVSVPLGILFGIYAALKKNKWQDHFVSTAVMVFISVPSYVYAFLVQYFLYFKLGILPLTMYSLADAGGSYFTWKMFTSMIPAIIALSFGSIAGYTRFVRAELTESLTSEYMLLARTKGLTRAQATARHALKNAMVPVLPSILSEFIGLLSGSMIIEQIFSIPGVGQLYIRSLNLFDYDVFMMDCVFYTFVGLLAGIVLDLSYGFIDPRIRMGEK